MTATSSSDTPSDDTTAPDPDLGPVIGDDDADEAVVNFQLAAFDGRNRKTLHPMTARTDVDMSSVIAFTRFGGKAADKIPIGRKLGAMEKFLRKSIVDYDGISVMEAPRAVVDRDGEWADVASLPAGDTPRASDVRWVVGDNTDWPTEEDADEHAWAHGSSLRRFVAIWDSGVLRVKPSALEGLIDVIISEGGARPTASSKGSSRSSKPRARSGRR